MQKTKYVDSIIRVYKNPQVKKVVKFPLNKLVSGISILMLIFSAFAFAPVAGAVVTNWDVTGTYTWTVLGTYVHDITIDVQNSNGTFSGYGGYPAGSFPYIYPGQTSEVITGQVTGDHFSMTTTYLGPYGTGYTVTANGIIVSGGTISGAAPWSWAMTSGKAKLDDGDGLYGAADICPDTTDDTTWGVSWGNNRWQVQADADGVLGWYQNKPKGVSGQLHEMTYTYGCNGHQILEMLNTELGSVMNGHWKYGLSSSVLEDFYLDMNDGVLDGKYFIETVAVPANKSTNTPSVNPLMLGVNYILKARGTANAGDGIEFDADYSYRTPTSSTWTDAVSTYEYLGDTLLDLKVNDVFVNWDDDTIYNTDYTYWYEMTGTGAPVTFGVYDVYYPNNTGNLYVDIYAQL